MKEIIYLSGAVRDELAGKSGLGFILTPNMGTRASRTVGQVWAADNGCFSQPAKYSDERYLAWLAHRDASTCLFATAPDVLGDAKATLARSGLMLPLIRAAGYKAALVAQDGLEDCEIPWDSFDVLFIGGSTEWKLSEAAAGICREASRRGKWVHMGRVNSLRRLRYAQRIGCDSADGTCVAFAPSKVIPKLLSWLRALNDQRQMFCVEGI